MSKRTTVHLVYPHEDRISAPDAIGRKLGDKLSERYSVVYHDWEASRPIKPGSNDVLIGHAHPSSRTTFRLSLKEREWKRRLLLGPYHHGDRVQMAWADRIMAQCDLFLAITGNYWFSTVDSSIFSHWYPKMVHLDLAVDRRDFPPVKKDFNAAGRRRFLYIGHSGWQKNCGYLSQLAKADASLEIAWIGHGRRGIEGVTALGVRDFKSDAGKQLVAEHDFLISVANADANPATILEAMAWGLVPVSTRESGYAGYPGIINIPIGDVGESLRILSELQWAPSSSLDALQSENWRALDTHFNWDRFARQVVEAIESEDSPSLDRETASRKLQLRLAEWASPYSSLRPTGLARTLKRRLRHR